MFPYWRIYFAHPQPPPVNLQSVLTCGIIVSGFIKNTKISLPNWLGKSFPLVSYHIIPHTSGSPESVPQCLLERSQKVVPSVNINL